VGLPSYALSLLACLQSRLRESLYSSVFGIYNDASNLVISEFKRCKLPLEPAQLAIQTVAKFQELLSTIRSGAAPELIAYESLNLKSKGASVARMPQEIVVSFARDYYRHKRCSGSFHAQQHQVSFDAWVATLFRIIASKFTDNPILLDQYQTPARKMQCLEQSKRMIDHAITEAVHAHMQFDAILAAPWGKESLQTFGELPNVGTGDPYHAPPIPFSTEREGRDKNEELAAAAAVPIMRPSYHQGHSNNGADVQPQEEPHHPASAHGHSKHHQQQQNEHTRSETRDRGSPPKSQNRNERGRELANAEESQSYDRNHDLAVRSRPASQERDSKSQEQDMQRQRQQAQAKDRELERTLFEQQQKYEEERQARERERRDQMASYEQERRERLHIQQQLQSMQQQRSEEQRQNAKLMQSMQFELNRMQTMQQMREREREREQERERDRDRELDRNADGIYGDKASSQQSSSNGRSHPQVQGAGSGSGSGPGAGSRTGITSAVDLGSAASVLDFFAQGVAGAGSSNSKSNSANTAPSTMAANTHTATGSGSGSGVGVVNATTGAYLRTETKSDNKSSASGNGPAPASTAKPSVQTGNATVTATAGESKRSVDEVDVEDFYDEPSSASGDDVEDGDEFGRDSDGYDDDALGEGIMDEPNEYAQDVNEDDGGESPPPDHADADDSTSPSSSLGTPSETTSSKPTNSKSGIPTSQTATNVVAASGSGTNQAGKQAQQALLQSIEPNAEESEARATLPVQKAVEPKVVIV